MAGEFLQQCCRLGDGRDGILAKFNFLFFDGLRGGLLRVGFLLANAPGDYFPLRFIAESREIVSLHRNGPVEPQFHFLVVRHDLAQVLDRIIKVLCEYQIRVSTVTIDRTEQPEEIPAVAGVEEFGRITRSDAGVQAHGHRRDVIALERLVQEPSIELPCPRADQQAAAVGSREGIGGIEVFQSLQQKDMDRIDGLVGRGGLEIGALEILLIEGERVLPVSAQFRRTPGVIEQHRVLRLVL